jgi:hypothetical protein
MICHSERSRPTLFSSAFAAANASACAVELSLFDFSPPLGVSLPIFFRGADPEVGSLAAVVLAGLGCGLYLEPA